MGLASRLWRFRQQHVKTKDVHRQHGINDLVASGAEETAEAFMGFDEVFAACFGHGVELLAELGDESQFVIEVVLAGLRREVAESHESDQESRQADIRLCNPILHTITMNAHCRLAVTLILLSAALDLRAADGLQFTPLFPADGIPKGWIVRAWADMSKPGPSNAVWKVSDGVLHGSDPRGTWLMSERSYTNFVLEFEFLLGERGNSGCALRSPLNGDPVFDGMELQMADLRYNTKAKDSELTGGLYRAVEPTKQVYRPTEWNRYQITLQDNRLKVVLNGDTVQDINLDEQEQVVTRHDGTTAPPIKDRPRQGHIGFQELSRTGHVAIRNARIKELP